MMRSNTAVEARRAVAALDELCRAPPVGPRPGSAARGRRPAGTPALGPHDDWRFDAAALRRVRCMLRIERDFDAVPELAALVADLEDEIARLRAELRRASAGASTPTSLKTDPKTTSWNVGYWLLALLRCCGCRTSGRGSSQVEPCPTANSNRRWPTSASPRWWCPRHTLTGRLVTPDPAARP
jgi:chaperone modulatory protein CbpM